MYRQARLYNGVSVGSVTMAVMALMEEHNVGFSENPETAQAAVFDHVPHHQLKYINICYC